MIVDDKEENSKYTPIEEAEAEQAIATFDKPENTFASGSAKENAVEVNIMDETPTIGEHFPLLDDYRDSVDDLAVEVEKVSTSSLRTRYFGTFLAHGFWFKPKNEDLLVLTLGDITSVEAPLVRIHSRCLTGDVFDSVLCECGQQLEFALEKIHAEGVGIIIYLEQEGRGSGLLAKLKGYELTEKDGLDTVDAYLTMSLPVDNRSYDAAIHVLKYLKISAVRLLTNNPNKISALQKANIIVTREPIEITPNLWNRDYLRTKKLRMGHLLK